MSNVMIVAPQSDADATGAIVLKVGSKLNKIPCNTTQVMMGMQSTILMNCG